MPPRAAECSRVGLAADSPLREMDSNFWFLVAKGQTVIRDRTAVSKTGADLLGNRRFESISLQRRVSCEPEDRTIEPTTAGSDGTAADGRELPCMASPWR